MLHVHLSWVSDDVLLEIHAQYFDSVIFQCLYSNVFYSCSVAASVLLLILIVGMLLVSQPRQNIALVLPRRKDCKVTFIKHLCGERYPSIVILFIFYKNKCASAVPDLEKGMLVRGFWLDYQQ